jgi:general secretion pathway protein F
MAAFDYVALDLKGAQRTGVLTAVDEAEARLLLERRRMAPVRIQPAQRSVAAPSINARLTSGQLALVTRQLATLISVAPLEEALRTLALQAEKPKVRRVLEATHAGVLEGFRLSDAMARQPKAWPPLYRAMISAGEASGALPSILERLADLMEKEQVVRAKVTTALVYPIVLAAVAIIVVACLMAFVVPKVVDQFESMGQQLPLLTRLVIGLSDAVRLGWWAILGGLALAVLLFLQALRRPAFKLAFDGWLLRLPMLGRLIRDLNAARMARTLSAMIASGLPVLEGLQITAPTIRNAVLRRATEQMATDIREGGGLSAALRRAGVFPPILVHMTASGENAGRLEPMMERAADYLEREFSTVTSVALSLLEPAIIILMGGIVAVIVLSILLPILQINTLALS